MEKLDIVVLYIEDDPLVRETTIRVLGKIVRKVIPAGDGLEGLEIYKKLKPDVVLTDLNLPNIDGLTLAKLIIAIDKNTPVVIVTSHSDVTYLLDAIKTRVHGFIIKPLDIEYIYSLFSKLTRELFLKREVDKHTKRIQTLLDFQVDMIVMTDGIKVYEANKKFLEFTYCVDITEFNQTYEAVSALFLPEMGYINNVDNWLEELNPSNSRQPRVKMKDIRNDTTKTYLLKYNKVPEENIYIISFVDITEIEKKTITLEKEVGIDELTGVFNRKKFNEMYEVLVDNSIRSQQSLSIVLIDIDHFKSINDTYGHKTGDVILKEVSDVVRKNIRSSDTFFRWGGEEFVLLLPKTAIKGAKILSEKIRTLVENYKFSIDRKVTISLGVTEYFPGENKDTAFLRTDEALYLAKNNGRNRVEVK